MYTESNNLGEYFIPAGSAALDIEAVDASPAVHAEWVCVRSCQVKRVMFNVAVTVAADGTAPVVEFNRRPTQGSASGEVLMDNITIPDGTAAGTIMYVDLAQPVAFAPGETLALEHTVQATDAGTAAGDGYYGALCIDDPEVPGNETNMVASA